MSDKHQPEPHPLCVMLRQLRQAAGLSLQEFQNVHGIPAVVMGSYERGDRVPPLTKLTEIFDRFGYTVTAVPRGADAIFRAVDMSTALRTIADQIDATARDVRATPE